jgi:wyosine [tRNA(Phe)-imidazoG37] synthetase (radical SAM superfamily)
MKDSEEALKPAFRDHPATWNGFSYVYPVISRRARGISIGINLNPDKTCNFDCIYCQIDRKIPASLPELHLDILESELRRMIDMYRSGELLKMEPFKSAPKEFQKLKDIAFSGEGEPTSCQLFPKAVDLLCSIKKEMLDSSVKLVLITNATLLHRPYVQEGIDVLYKNGGEVWAKLDAGTSKYFQEVNRGSGRIEQILRNIRWIAKKYPICIQTMFLRINGKAAPTTEIEAYCHRLNYLKSRACQIQEVQIYSVARDPAESFVSALTTTELEEISSRIRKETALEVQVYSS